MTDRGKHKESTGASQLRDENTKLRARVDFLEQELGWDEDPMTPGARTVDAHPGVPHASTAV